MAAVHGDGSYHGPRSVQQLADEEREIVGAPDRPRPGGYPGASRVEEPYVRLRRVVVSVEPDQFAQVDRRGTSGPITRFP
jgi:hypothetical protein